jgi:protein-L-isoaspartate(D-aspartate) O-methyltransferase
MLKVPRHLFVQEALRPQAYADRPLQIGEYQTISQPYMVALMTQLLQLKGDATVLEIGTGSGYQAAILAELADRVYSVERLNSLKVKARRVLDQLGYTNVVLKLGDGTLGWPEYAPFGGIIVTAGAPDIPQPLVDQLAEGARLVVPVGDQDTQVLKIVTRTAKGVKSVDSIRCRFVKLVGRQGWEK